MGKVAGAALKIAAPEAALAGKAAGAGKDPRKSAPGSKAAQQRQDIEDIKGRRKPDEHEDQDHEHEDQDHEPAGRGGGPLAGMEGPATGGGFVLGLMVWALVRAYIGGNKDAAGQELPGGVDGVKRLVRAKFLNKTS